MLSFMAPFANFYSAKTFSFSKPFISFKHSIIKLQRGWTFRRENFWKTLEKNIWNKLRKLLETFFVIPLRIVISTITLLKSQFLVFCSPFKMKFKKSCVTYSQRRQYLGWIFNYRIGCLTIKDDLFILAKQPNLKLKTQPKQLSGSLDPLHILFKQL